MKQLLVLVESDSDGLRAALVRDRRLEAIEIDWFGQPSLVGAIGQGRIVRTVAGMGTIVRLGEGPELLLPRGKDKATPAAGDNVLVQILRDPDGGKLGTATTAISRIGRALVHLPLESGMTVSRRLVLDPARQAELEAMLRALPGGWIVRHAAAHLELSEVAFESISLAAEGAALPAFAAPPDAFRRLIVDHILEQPPRILVAGRAALAAVEHWCEHFTPDMSPHIEYHDPGANLFDSHDLDSAIGQLRQARVPFGNGASLIIEPTAALTAIDVNAGPETNNLAVNLAAAAEIARQLRLRHIGGLIVIDFISLPRPRDAAKVADALRDALADDAAQTHILPMSRFGLIEMTRDRRGPRLVLPE